MQDTKLFETILGITTPWHVARVELKTEDKRVDLWLEHEPTRWPCPECGDVLPGFDHAEARTWRHLDTCQFQTHLHAEIPRVQCPAHGVKQVRVPWAEPRSRFTLLMERLIIDLILQCSTVKGACQIGSVSWDEAWGIMSRAVARGQARKEARPITYIGVDEKAFRKGHRYHTIVCDLERATVEFVADDRKTESLAGYYAQLADAQKIALHAVAMDMWEPYIGATRKGLPDGDTKIVFDRFHIMRDMTKAVDTVRKQEHRTFLRDGGDSPLTGTKYLWLFSEERRPERHEEAFANTPGPESESRSRVGDQRSPPHPVDLPPACGGETILHPLVWLGGSLAARARKGRRGHAQTSSRGGPPVRQAPDHQWCCRRS
jgi:transposase